MFKEALFATKSLFSLIKKRLLKKRTSGSFFQKTHFLSQKESPRFGKVVFCWWEKSDFWEVVFDDRMDAWVFRQSFLRTGRSRTFWKSFLAPE